jgi:hypothetical protein
MTALATDTPRAYELGETNTLPVKASTKIYEGAAVGDDASGYARGLVAGDEFRGFCIKQADNSATATDGYINVQVRSSGKAQLAVTSLVITSVGAQVFASDDATFTLDSNGGANSYIGTVYRYVSAGVGIVSFAAKGDRDDESVTLGMMADLTRGSIISGQTASNRPTALDMKTSGQIGIGDGTDFKSVAVSGDITISSAGVTAIGSGKVTSAMLASGSGVAALLTAGLGGSVSVVKTDATTDTVLAAHATKDRACLVLVVVDEAYAIGTGTLPTVEVGEDDTIDKCMAHTVLTDEAAGTVLAFAFTNTATKKVIVTTTAAVGDSTGGCTVTVLAIPTT